MTFRQMTTKDKTLYDSFLSGNETNSESSFANMYAWRNVMDTKIAFDDENSYFIYTKRNGKQGCCFPKGRNSVSGIKKLIDFFHSSGQEFIMESVTSEEIKIISENFDCFRYTEDPDLYDYVYTGEKLRTLPGKKLHSKRNHINKFKSLCPEYKYVNMEAKHLDICLDFSHKWLMEKWGSDENIEFKNEYSSIKEFLMNFDEFGLSGGILIADDTPIAFTIGEKLNKNTCVVHIEKAMTSYHGAYTMINNLYINNCWQDIEYVNREEDMGIDGIRKAKKSYYPDYMIKKYTVTFK